MNNLITATIPSTEELVNKVLTDGYVEFNVLDIISGIIYPVKITRNNSIIEFDSNPSEFTECLDFFEITTTINSNKELTSFLNVYLAKQNLRITNLEPTIVDNSYFTHYQLPNNEKLNIFNNQLNGIKDIIYKLGNFGFIRFPDYTYSNWSLKIYSGFTCIDFPKIYTRGLTIDFNIGLQVLSYDETQLHLYISTLNEGKPIYFKKYLCKDFDLNTLDFNQLIKDLTQLYLKLNIRGNSIYIK